MELAELMYELGVETAYNLDGGGSSTMYFNGKDCQQTDDQWKEYKREECK